MGNFVTAREVKISELLTKINVHLPQVKNFNIHIPNRQLNQISIFGNKLLDGEKLGYSFLIFHDSRRSEEGQYIYNMDGKITIGYFSPQEIIEKVAALKFNETTIDINQKYKVDYLQRNIYFSDKISNMNRSIMESLGDINNNLIEMKDSDDTGMYDVYGADTQLFEKFTKKEYACILLKVPETNEPWLNNLIVKSRELDKKKCII